MKFSDVIMAVASSVVVTILVRSVLGLAVIPLSSWGVDISSIVSFLVSGLIIGYVFAGSIQEEKSRMASIGKIAVLSAVVILFVARTGYAAVGPHYSGTVDDFLKSMYSTGSWTNTDWWAHEEMVLHLFTAGAVVYALVFGFIGLYLGSMRKPSAKTKE